MKYDWDRRNRMHYADSHLVLDGKIVYAAWRRDRSDDIPDYREGAPDDGYYVVWRLKDYTGKVIWKPVKDPERRQKIVMLCWPMIDQ